MNPYDYFFYRIYCFGIRLKTDSSEFSGITTISLFLSFNVLLFRKITGIELIHSKIQVAILYIGIFAINLFYFYWKKKYLRIIDKFEKESKIQKRVSIFLSLLYMFLSVYLLFYFSLN